MTNDTDDIAIEDLTLDDIKRMVASGELQVPDVNEMSREDLLETIDAHNKHHEEHHERESALKKRIAELEAPLADALPKWVTNTDVDDAIKAFEKYEPKKISLHNWRTMIACMRAFRKYLPATVTSSKETTNGQEN